MDFDPLYPRFGQLVRHQRRQLRLTQAQLAQLVGLSRTSITNIEKGRQKVLLDQVYALAIALQIDPDRLLPDVEELSSLPGLDEKLQPDLSDAERNWVRRVVRPPPGQ